MAIFNSYVSLPEGTVFHRNLVANSWCSILSTGHTCDMDVHGTTWSYPVTVPSGDVKIAIENGDL